MTIMIPAWEKGELIPVEKLEAHRRGLRHKAVSVFAMRDDKTLIQQRAFSKYHTPGLWANTCCTHPDWDEAVLECANRRLREELGLTDLVLSWRDQIEYRADVGNGLIEHEVVDLFTAQIPYGVEPIINPEEVAATRWVTFEALQDEIAQAPQNFTPWLKIYLDKHLAKIYDTHVATGA